MAGTRRSRAEPSRAEPRRAEPSRTTPCRAEPCRAVPSRTVPRRAGHAACPPPPLSPPRPAVARPVRPGAARHGAARRGAARGGGQPAGSSPGGSLLLARPRTPPASAALWPLTASLPRPDAPRLGRHRDRPGNPRRRGPGSWSPRAGSAAGSASPRAPGSARSAPSPRGTQPPWQLGSPIRRPAPGSARGPRCCPDPAAPRARLRRDAPRLPASVSPAGGGGFAPFRPTSRAALGWHRRGNTGISPAPGSPWETREARVWQGTGGETSHPPGAPAAGQRDLHCAADANSKAFPGRPASTHASSIFPSIRAWHTCSCLRAGQYGMMGCLRQAARTAQPPASPCLGCARHTCLPWSTAGT